MDITHVPSVLLIINVNDKRRNHFKFYLNMLICFVMTITD